MGETKELKKEVVKENEVLEDLFAPKEKKKVPDWEPLPEEEAVVYIDFSEKEEAEPELEPEVEVELEGKEVVEEAGSEAPLVEPEKEAEKEVSNILVDVPDDREPDAQKEKEKEVSLGLDENERVEEPVKEQEDKLQVFAEKSSMKWWKVLLIGVGVVVAAGVVIMLL